MTAQGLYYCLILVCCHSVVKAMPLNGISTTVKSEKYSTIMILRNEKQIKSTNLSDIRGAQNMDAVAYIPKQRVKRQSGAGKFVEAAEMPQIKLVRLFLQMFKNLWDDAYIGGSHPFHPNVPKTIMQLYKQKIVEFFIPDIEESKT